MPSKRDLKSYALPEGKKRRGSFIVRLALERVTLHQHRDALKGASRMVIALPLIQAGLLVGVMNAELWMLLLGLEGLLIAWLASSQLSKPNLESKAIGFGIALLNALMLGAVGIFLGSHVYWITGLIGMGAITWLVFRTTGKRTVKLAWLTYLLPLIALILFAATGRIALELSKRESDPQKRFTELQVAWLVQKIRGGNGTERALLRLRQAQSAFEQGDYAKAHEFAHDGVYAGGNRMRSIPQSVIGQDLLDSLLRVKAQSYYNLRWGKDETIATAIKNAPLEDELVNDDSTRIRWGW